MAANLERLTEPLNEAPGDDVGHEPVQMLCGLSERCFALYREATGGDVRSGETSRRHLVTRMMYISETTSVAIRLNATWALSLPAMSLVRDRYEQVVRFSWLARQSGREEMVKYLGSYYAKANKVYHGLSARERAEFGKMVGEVPDWMREQPTKEQRAYLERWERLDLLSMAQKRDALMPLRETYLGKAVLADLYPSTYRQFSSVSHFDMYAMRMIGLHNASDGQLVLTPSPWWPALLCLDTALFDLIQCYEALIAFDEIKDDAVLKPFEDMSQEWETARKRITELA